MIAGGTEAIINPLGITAFNALKALSTRNDPPQKASRPFDKDRDGFIISEGAVVLILESLEHALRRNVPILAEIVAYGATADGFHVTQPLENGEGAARAMTLAMKRGGIRPEEIDYINAHGTSTPLNDAMETKAIKTAFGDYAYKVPISSTKSMTGHLIGAAGAIEPAICIMTILKGVIPPTINYENPDPECDLDYVPNVARPARVEYGPDQLLRLRRAQLGADLQEIYRGRQLSHCRWNVLPPLPFHEGGGAVPAAAGAAPP